MPLCSAKDKKILAVRAHANEGYKMSSCIVLYCPASHAYTKINVPKEVIERTHRPNIVFKEVGHLG